MAIYDDNDQNWLKVAQSLRILRRRLRPFVENETEIYHNSLRTKIRNTSSGTTCQTKCNIKKWNPIPKKLPLMCVACVPWRDEILANHSAKEGPIHWNNCTPHLWPSKKWEVAKAYMPRGLKRKCNFDDFDISALLNLMTCCKYFRRFIQEHKLNQVIEVRNSVMHCPDMTFSKEEKEGHLDKIRDLGQALAQHAPDLMKLSEEIEMTPLYLIMVAQGPRLEAAFVPRIDDVSTVGTTFWTLKERTEFLLQCYDEGQLDGLKEAVRGTINCLERNKYYGFDLSKEEEILLWMEEQLIQQEKSAKAQQAARRLFLSYGLIFAVSLLWPRLLSLLAHSA
ncbi:uncharacterized protein CXorf38 homolog [Chanos chanos]|uniref:Uncharacterized protein CXorf38 homolog n=1 Tax=Chanos chanos TaxID=29144 RepID=A0A6J2V112_CHACN|nr:uncharacterized protein CXorf38 homolog [Chanos chanos]